MIADDLERTTTGGSDDWLPEGHGLHETEAEGLIGGCADHDVHRLHPARDIGLVPAEGPPLSPAKLGAPAPEVGLVFGSSWCTPPTTTQWTSACCRAMAG